jgi:hypothetical protein
VSEDKYEVTLTRQQLQTISLALEVLARLHSGQIHYAIDTGLSQRVFTTPGGRDAADKFSDELRDVLFPELASSGHYYSIGSKDAPMIGEAITIKEVLDTVLDGRDRGSIKWGSQPRPTVRVVKPDLNGGKTSADKLWDAGVRVENPLGNYTPGRCKLPLLEDAGVRVEKAGPGDLFSMKEVALAMMNGLRKDPNGFDIRGMPDGANFMGCTKCGWRTEAEQACKPVCPECGTPLGLFSVGPR